MSTVKQGQYPFTAKRDAKASRLANMRETRALEKLNDFRGVSQKVTYCRRIQKMTGFEQGITKVHLLQKNPKIAGFPEGITKHDL